MASLELGAGHFVLRFVEGRGQFLGPGGLFGVAAASSAASALALAIDCSRWSMPPTFWPDRCRKRRFAIAPVPARDSSPVRAEEFFPPSAVRLFRPAFRLRPRRQPMRAKFVQKPRGHEKAGQQRSRAAAGKIPHCRPPCQCARSVRPAKGLDRPMPVRRHRPAINSPPHCQWPSSIARHESPRGRRRTATTTPTIAATTTPNSPHSSGSALHAQRPRNTNTIIPHATNQTESTLTAVPEALGWHRSAAYWRWLVGDRSWTDSLSECPGRMALLDVCSGLSLRVGPNPSTILPLLQTAFNHFALSATGLKRQFTSSDSLAF